MTRRNSIWLGCRLSAVSLVLVGARAITAPARAIGIPPLRRRPQAAPRTRQRWRLRCLLPRRR